MEKIRIDKWLWSVRIFKSRSIAAEACRKNQVKSADTAAKASFMIKIGDRIGVRKNGFDYQFEVVKLITKRVSAPLARECYIDHTPAEELSKYKDWFIGKSRPEKREKGEGRPTKRERRKLDSFKDPEFES